MAKKIVAIMALLIAGFALTGCDPFFPYWDHDRGYHRGHDKDDHDRGYHKGHNKGDHDRGREREGDRR